MWRRGALVAVASLPAFTVKANSSENQTTVKACELSLYDAPPPPKLEFVSEEEGPVRRGVSSARQVVWKYLDSIQDTTDAVYDKYEIAKTHTKDLLQYLRDDSGAVPRLTFITVAGLGGVIAGYKGGIIRKTMYASFGMLSAAAICYPNQSVDISRTAWNRVSTDAMTVWRQNFPSEAASSEKTEESKTTEQLNAPEQTIIAPSEPAGPSPKPKAPLESQMDHGMSKPEDKDMYTTRGG